MAATAQLSPLQGADGSAVFSTNGLSVLASVNGPIEVQRRDEIPDEAAIEVNVRPAAGVGGVRERHFESIIQKALRQIIRLSMHPRTLIQITLQVTATSDQDGSAARPSQAASMLYLLPPLLNAAMLALLSTSIPMFTTMASIFIAVHPGGLPIADPPLQTLEKASSVHAFAYSSQGSLLLVESEGSFDFATWEKVATMAKARCCGQVVDQDQEDVEMVTGGDTSLGSLIRRSVEEKVRAAESWRQGIK